ncbi:EpsG family protein [Methylomonas methanica]|uniref:Uncharacterized protein n=1 Tax=Methylomonas methanica (strain DSM 25384 / MC09) TaxID=857087 RepID=F9ZWF4_METMM|nr:EpsG family protein [Methylomonas methanica]AEF99623.1 hypothetical protein Metme_1195 [Methylomonas methanica MC09]
MISFKTAKARILLKYLSFLGLGVIAAVLCQTASKDWWTYSSHLYGYYSVHSSWEEMWQSFSVLKEPLYFFPAKFFGELLSFSVFIAITTVTLLVVKLHFLTKIVDNVWAACFFYGSLYLFLFEGTVLRTAFATALIFPAFYCLQKTNVTGSLFLVVLATQIHLTSIVFFLMYPLYFCRRINWLVFVFFAISPFLVLMNFSIYDMLFQVVNVFTDKYQIYAIEKDLTQQNSTGLFFFFIGFFYLIILILVYFLRVSLLTDPFKLMLLSLSMLGVIAMCILHDHVAVAARFGELLLICVVPLLSWLLLYFNEHNMKYYQRALILTFCSYGIARFVYLFPSLIF